MIFKVVNDLQAFKGLNELLFITVIKWNLNEKFNNLYDHILTMTAPFMPGRDYSKYFST